jgi:ADP-heptose:LPS heptosyltransferase
VKIDFMREMDIFLGGFIINIVNLFFIFRFGRKPISPRPEKVKNILVIKFFGLGSILLMTPAINGLKSLYPKANICLLTFANNREFCLRLGGIDRVLTLRSSSFFVLVVDILRNLLILWRIRPSIVIDGEFFSNFTSLISLLTLSRVRVGYHLRQVARGKCLTHQVPLNTHHHITHVFYSLVAALGAPYEEVVLSDLSLHSPSPDEHESAHGKLNLSEDSKIIIVNPNASSLSVLRRWPADYFVYLISRLADKYSDHDFVFVGNKKEYSYVQSITEKISLDNILNSSGRLSIGEYCAILKASKLIITNDSFPTHIASAYKKGVAVFFGPETPDFYGPLSTNAVSFFENIPCSPCLIVFDNKAENNCKDNICLKQIHPDRVLRKIEEKFFKDELALISKENR